MFKIKNDPMRKWLANSIGQYYIGLVYRLMRPLVTNAFGYHLLIIAEPELADCITCSPIKHHILINQNIDSQRNIYSFCCAKEDQLPIDSESVDIVYLAHCLELSANPHEILREAYRVLRPDGRIIISGFNPWSIWGCYYLVGRILRFFPWKAKLISLFKLKDWLKLLGFSNLQTKSLFYLVPILQQSSTLPKLQLIEKIASNCHLPFGGAYLTMAYKKVIALTPIVPNWQGKNYLFQDKLAETVSSKYGVIKKQ